MQIEDTHFTVAMSVYINDKPEYLREAVASIYDRQSVKPSEIILVKDGPVHPDVDAVIDELCKSIPVLRVFPFAENHGHAFARQQGLENANNELVAIMDADDISVPDRFEMQLKAFSQHPDTSVVGGIINEFIGKESDVVGSRIVPECDSEIKKYLKSRCPMNLVSVMYKKSDVTAVGGFIDWFCEEDYYLWVRLMMAGYSFYNVQHNFVNVRIGKCAYQRRGGMRYFLSEAKLQRFMWKKGLIGFVRLFYNVSIRFVLQVVMPNDLRGWIFRHFARK